MADGSTVGQAVPIGWTAAVDRLQNEQSALVAGGRWRGGDWTLLQAIGRHHDELVLTAGLGWLLVPDGHHGLGGEVLARLLLLLRLSAEPDQRVSVRLEETKADSRADLVLRVGDVCVLIEAKVWAGEQRRQCDRLAELWADEAPCLVFLSRDGRRPATAVASGPSWRTLRWSQIADIVRDAASVVGDVAGGVRDYVDTIDRFHAGGSAVTLDAKTEFYLRNRRQIEEWAALGEGVIEQLHGALSAIGSRFDDPDEDVHAELGRGPWPRVLLRRAEWPPDIGVAVGWHRESLLVPDTENEWAWAGMYVGRNAIAGPEIALDPLIAGACARIGWNEQDGSIWPRWKRLPGPNGVFDIEEYVGRCAEELRSGWAALAPVLDGTVGQASP